MDKSSQVAALYKTSLCKFHLSSRCLKGDQCTHAHSEEELVSKPDFTKTRQCREMAEKGMCRYPNCKFSHDPNSPPPIRPSSDGGNHHLSHSNHHHPRHTSASSRSYILCKHYLYGNCLKGNNCYYLHQDPMIHHHQQQLGRSISMPDGTGTGGGSGDTGIIDMNQPQLPREFPRTPTGDEDDDIVETNLPPPPSTPPPPPPPHPTAIIQPKQFYNHPPHHMISDKSVLLMTPGNNNPQSDQIVNPDDGRPSTSDSTVVGEEYPTGGQTFYVAQPLPVWQTPLPPPPPPPPSSSQQQQQQQSSPPPHTIHHHYSYPQNPTNLNTGPNILSGGGGGGGLQYHHQYSSSRHNSITQSSPPSHVTSGGGVTTGNGGTAPTAGVVYYED